MASDICECFGLSVVCSPHTPKPEDEIRSLKEKNEILKEELKRATEKSVADAIINHMKNSRISIMIKKVIEKWLERLHNCIGTVKRRMKSMHMIGGCLYGSIKKRLEIV